VRFGGMKVGSITTIHPSPEDPTKIEVLLEVKRGTPVNADSVAMLTSLSPLGDKYLEITTGSNKAPRLPPAATIRSTEPVSLDDLARQASALIPVVQSTLQDVGKDINQLTSNAQTVLANVQSMTGPQNQRNFTLLLANARELLDKESPKIDTVLHNLERASAQASATLDEVQKAARTANDTFASANSTFANANRTVDEIRDPIKRDLADLHQTMSEAQGLITDLRTIVSSNRYNIDETLENFRAASENLREFTSSVQQRPWLLLRGKPAPDRAVPLVGAKR